MALLWLSLILLGGLAQPQSIHGQTPPRALVLAWDGAVPSFVHHMLEKRQLPHLAKLIESGAFSDRMISSFPSFTAPSFASLWTGAPASITGVSGNRVPRLPENQYTILESTLGFNQTLLQAEPLWAVAQRAGRRLVVTHVPFGGEKSDFGVYFQGYGGVAGRDGVINRTTAKPRPAKNWTHLPPSDKPPLELQFAVSLTPFFGLLFDDPADPEAAYDTLLITRQKNGRAVLARLKAGLSTVSRPIAWSDVIDLETAGGQSAQCYFRLFDLRPDGDDFLLYHTTPTREMISPPDLILKLRAEAGIFIGNGASQIYRQGGLGQTIPNGGSGLAEKRYLETIVFTQHQLFRVNSWALKNLPWDIFFAYTPFPDEAEHQWRGYLDLNLPGARKEIAERLRPFLEEVYRICDDFLGLFMANRPDNAFFMLISDHGMEGVNKSFGVNRALQNAGLITADGRGRVDLTKTKVFYPSNNNGYLLINSTNRKEGIVAPHERTTLLHRVREVLFAVRDGDRQVVTAIHDVEIHRDRLGIGGATGGDIYIDLAPGYDFDWRAGAGPIIARREPVGLHGFNPLRASMRTIMVLSGPGVAAGRRLGDVRLIDIAPTLAKLLDLPRPRDAIGRVLDEALTEPR